MITKFYNFIIERTDLSKSREISIYADDILSKYLNKIKKLIENNEQLNIHKQDPKFNYIDYEDYTIYFLEDFSPGKINLEKKEINVDNELRIIIDSIKNKDKKEALNIFFNNILSNIELLSQTKIIIAHELAHKNDPYNYINKETRYSKKLSELRNKIENEKNSDLIPIKNKIYYNFYTEINSFFLEFCIQVLDLIEDGTFSKSDINFNSLFNKFKNNKRKLYNNLDEKNKKRIKNRLYNFYEDIKQL